MAFGHQSFEHTCRVLPGQFGNGSAIHRFVPVMRVSMRCVSDLLLLQNTHHIGLCRCHCIVSFYLINHAITLSAAAAHATLYRAMENGLPTKSRAV